MRSSAGLARLSFSSQQRRAIEAPLGPVLVVAGPGAGKTACLIGRVRHLVDRLGVAPERICAVTFTNKAAEEIATRLRDWLGRKAEQVRRGTIHALCAELLREFPEPAGLTPGFGIADDDYQQTVLRRLGHGRRAAQLLSSFGRRRLAGRALTPGDEQIFADYQAALRRRNVVDFDDLVVLAARLFEDRPDIAARVAARWDYVLVDEFQDVNAAQYAILRRLAEPHGNVFVVGDDEQSIFAFTGADPRVLARFQQDYGIRQPVVLDLNYRCSRQIFDVARQLLEENPLLFGRKDVRAEQLSVFGVRAAAFADDDEESEWIIRDIVADREANGLDWGDYAVLYRRHEAGVRLEPRFIRAGLPCRLARGKALCEDPVIGYVIAALRLLRDVTDGAAAEAFARKVLPEHLMQRVEMEACESGEHFLQVLRDLAATMRADPDAKKLWRLVFQVENLAALRERHQTLWGLVEELLSQRVGPYRNALEERHTDLTDPLDDPAAVALAQRLSLAQRDAARVVLERAGGLEIALRGMLFGAGFRLVRYADEVEQAELDDVRVGPDDAGQAGLSLTVFRALQVLHARGIDAALTSYVTFDIETTELDTAQCEIVEIAAVRVVDGRPAGEFHSLVRPERPVSPAAAAIHGHDDTALAGAPAFAAVWPEFQAFVAGMTLVAHNGVTFDLPVLRRMAAPLGGAERLAVFDTLPLARVLSGERASLASLAERFGVAAGRAHHAIDDARTLVGVYQALERLRVARARKSALVNLLPYLGLALVIEPTRTASEETDLLLGIARNYALGRFSDCLEFYDAERRRTALHSPALDEVIQRLGGRARMDKLREEVDASRRYPAAVARLEELIEQQPGETLDDAIERLLTRVALSASHGADVQRHSVNLLTLHSTKGLEFSRVYVVGVEDEQLPGWFARDEDVAQATQESRRLLYVGMTRARERLVLTRADQRRGKPGGGSRFLEEMGLQIERPLLAPLAP